MHAWKNFALAFVMILGVTAMAAVPASADDHDTDPVVIKIVNDDPHRIHGALGFAQFMTESGHPVTVWVTDRAVRIASKERAGNLARHQQMLNDLIKKNVKVIICPMCMEEYGVKEADLIPGATAGKPELISEILFKDNAKLITW